MLKTWKQSFFLFVVLALSVSAKADHTVSFQSYILQLLEKQVMTDADLLQLETELEEDRVANPIQCAHICSSSTRQIHHKAFKTLLDKELDVSLLKDWLRNLLIKRGHQREEREQVEKDTHQLYRPDGLAPAKIAAGSNVACAIDRRKKVCCWGKMQTWGYDGDAEVPAQSLVPPDLPDAIEIAVSDSHACILSDRGTVHCWGGDGFSEETVVPSALLRVTKITVGGQSTCVIQESGEGICWGYDKVEKIFNSSAKICQITVSRAFTCIASAEESMLCHDFYDEPILNLPANVKGLMQLDAGNGALCALVQEELTVVPRCWVLSTLFGTGKTILNQLPKDFREPIQISVADNYACALEADGEPVCWGEKAPSPENPEAIVQIASGSYYTCGVGVSGRPYCWGIYSSGNPVDDVPADLIVDTSWWDENRKGLAKSRL